MVDTVRTLAANIARAQPGAGTGSGGLYSDQDYRDFMVSTAAWSGASGRNILPLDVATVTTGGVAVTALAAGKCTAGGKIKNPENAIQNLGINQITTASGTTSNGSTYFIVPGETFPLTASVNAVSVISSDSAHPFAGEGWT